MPGLSTPRHPIALSPRLVATLALAALLAAVACAVQGLRLQWDLREIAQMLGGTPDLTEPHRWLAGAAACLAVAFGLGGWHQVLQRQALGPLPALNLRQLGSPLVPTAQLVRLAVQAYSPLLLLVLALLAFKGLLVLGRHALNPWVFLATTLALMALICLGLLPWVLRRLVRLSAEPRMEPLFNFQGLQRLRRSTLLPSVLAPGEAVLESFVLSHPRPTWVVLTSSRWLCLRRTWQGDRLERSFALGELRPPPPEQANSRLGRLGATVRRWTAPYQLKYPLMLHDAQGRPALHGVMASAAVRQRLLQRLAQGQSQPSEPPHVHPPR